MTADLFPEIPHRCENVEMLVRLDEEGVPLTFTCARCGQECCSACQAAADDAPDLCNVCWAETPSSTAVQTAAFLNPPYTR